MKERERKRLPILAASTACLAILALSGCKPSAIDPTSAGAETPPTDVSTVTVAATTVPRFLDLPGRLAPTRVAEVRAQVSGIIRQRVFEEGSLVKKDDVLFQIDPAIYKAEVDVKAAAVAKAEATQVQAQRQSERTETLTELMYFESTSDTSGTAQITASFAPGSDAALATVAVPNRIKRIEARLPRPVIQQGVIVEEASTSFLQFVALSSRDGSMSDTDLGDLAAHRVVAELRRVPGVGRATLFSSE